MINEFYWCPQCERCEKTGLSGMCYMCFIIVNSELCKKCDRYKLLNKHGLCDLCSLVLNICECSWCKLKKSIGIDGVCKLCMLVKQYRRYYNKANQGPRTTQIINKLMKNYNKNTNTHNTKPINIPSTKIHNLLDYRYDYNIVKRATIKKNIFKNNQTYFENLFDAVRAGDKRKIKDNIKNIVGTDINVKIHFSKKPKIYIDGTIEDIITLDVKISSEKDKNNAYIDKVFFDDGIEYWQ